MVFFHGFFKVFSQSLFFVQKMLIQWRDFFVPTFFVYVFPTSYGYVSLPLLGLERQKEQKFQGKTN